MISHNQSNTPTGQGDEKEMVHILRNLDPLDPEEEGGNWQKLRALDRELLFNLLTAILSSDNVMRYVAAEVLLRLYPREGIHRVLSRLKNADEDLRFHICGLLADYGHEEAVEPLVEIVLEDPSGNVRHVAAFALTKIGNARALPALRWVQQHDLGTDYEGRPVSEMAAEAIEEILAREHARPR